MTDALRRTHRVFRMCHVLRSKDGVHYESEGSYWVANWMFDQLSSSASTDTNQSSSQPK